MRLFRVFSVLGALLLAAVGTNANAQVCNWVAIYGSGSGGYGSTTYQYEVCRDSSSVQYATRSLTKMYGTGQVLSCSINVNSGYTYRNTCENAYVVSLSGTGNGGGTTDPVNQAVCGWVALYGSGSGGYGSTTYQYEVCRDSSSVQYASRSITKSYSGQVLSCTINVNSGYIYRNICENAVVVAYK